MKGGKEIKAMAHIRTMRMSVRLPVENMKKDLMKLISERHDEDIINFLETQSSDIGVSFNVSISVKSIELLMLTYFYKATVLQLTVLNDPDTLKSILTWGKNNNLTPTTGGEYCKDRNNPILVACQHDFRTCMEHLYRHGYRMPPLGEDTDRDTDCHPWVRIYIYGYRLPPLGEDTECTPLGEYTDRDTDYHHCVRINIGIQTVTPG